MRKADIYDIFFVTENK